jgi:hypothetical protein
LIKAGSDYHTPGSINVSELAANRFLNANCCQPFGEVLGYKELRRDRDLTGLVDIAKLATFGKTSWKIGLVVFEQVKRIQGSVVTREYS